MKGFASRLEWLIERHGGSAAELARLVNLTEATLSAWKHGRNKPGSNSITHMAHILGYDSAALVRFMLKNGPEPKLLAQSRFLESVDFPVTRHPVPPLSTKRGQAGGVMAEQRTKGGPLEVKDLLEIIGKLTVDNRTLEAEIAALKRTITSLNTPRVDGHKPK